jgi:hypothetical protein
MAEMVYVLCAATSAACCLLLWAGYRRARARLLLWSCLCFGGLALNNVLLFLDMSVFPDLNLLIWRNLTALGSILLLLVGLVWDAP